MKKVFHKISGENTENMLKCSLKQATTQVVGMLVRSFTLYLSNGFNPSGNSPLDNPNGKFKEEEMRHKPGN